jgi:hypothetical protein
VIHRELRRKGVTLQLLWIEYKRDHPGGYLYTQFVTRYRAWEYGIDRVLRQGRVRECFRFGSSVFLYLFWGVAGVCLQQDTKKQEDRQNDNWPVPLSAEAAGQYGQIAPTRVLRVLYPLT